MNNLMIVSEAGKPQQGNFDGLPEPTQPVDFTVSIKTKPIAAEDVDELNKLITDDPSKRKYLTHEQLEKKFKIDETDFNSLESYFKKNNISVKHQNALTGEITLTGDVRAVEKSFNTSVGVFKANNGDTFLSGLSHKLLPVDVASKIKELKVFSKPAKKEFRTPYKIIDNLVQTSGKGVVAEAKPQQNGYSVPELAKAYQFPEGLTGKGQVIAVIELGGKLSMSDFNRFFSQLKLKAPQVIEIGTPPAIDEQSSSIYNAEVTLDLEVLGAIAPESKLVVYYGNTIAEAMKLIIADHVNKPTIVSISWAGSEYNYSPQDISEMDLLFYQAALLGMTVVAASADHGAMNNMAFPNVSLPSSNPLVLGCGGTLIDMSGDKITSQVVWNEAQGKAASGGGYSHLYNLPSYQNQAVAKYPYMRSIMRGVPDIAAYASMLNGYQVVFNGNNLAIGGTSAATPFICGLLALINEKLGYKLGFINSILYGFAGSEIFSQVVEGNNQIYPAAPFWNPCTGLGTPVGYKMLELFERLQKTK